MQRSHDSLEAVSCHLVVGSLSSKLESESECVSGAGNLRVEGPGLDVPAVSGAAEGTASSGSTALISSSSL